MKLFVVGTAPQSNIILNSSFVSAYHAEIIMLDNGDIFIIDKNSTNGTRINGNPINPGIEIPVRRGESVVFADTPLDWNSVPTMIPDPNAKRIISVGSHNRNQIKVVNGKVSRFHATIKESRDGRWTICDHSTNGTTINGKRIPKDTYVPLRKGDKIACAGCPVENPVIGGASFSKTGIYVGAAAAALVVVVALVWALFHGKMSDEEIHNKYQNSVVFVEAGYHYKFTAGVLDLKEVLGFDEFSFDVRLSKPIIPIRRDKDGNRVNNDLIKVWGSGFFISETGLIATNLHVAEPWQYRDVTLALREWLKTALLQGGLAYDPIYLNYIAEVEVKGVIDYLYVTPNNTYYTHDGTNAINCIERVASQDKEIDVAVLQTTLRGGKLPEGCTYINLHDAAKNFNYNHGKHVYTLGFPVTSDMLNNMNNKPLSATGSAGAIQNKVSDYTFGHSAITRGGASGSPMFNDHGQLIGIVSAHDADDDNYKHSVRTEYLIELLDSKKINY